MAWWQWMASSSSTSSGCPFFLETAQSGVLAILKGLSSTPSTATDRFWPRLGLSSHWYNRSSASADHDPCMPRGHRANAAWIAWILCPNSCAETPRRDSWHTRVPCWICAMMSIVLGGCLSKRLKVGTVAEVDAEDMDVGAKRRQTSWPDSSTEPATSSLGGIVLKQEFLNL